jgi:UDPglucose 6-dehydrogenase
VLKEKHIGVLGLTFKQNTDDVRNSPSIDLCHRMLADGARLRVHDPKGMEKARSFFPAGSAVEYVSEAEAVAAGCDALVIATEWSEFGRLDWARIKANMATPIVFDGRNLLDPVEMRELGFLYRSVGR